MCRTTLVALVPSHFCHVFRTCIHPFSLWRNWRFNFHEPLCKLTCSCGVYIRFVCGTESGCVSVLGRVNSVVLAASAWCWWLHVNILVRTKEKMRVQLEQWEMQQQNNCPRSGNSLLV